MLRFFSHMSGRHRIGLLLVCVFLILVYIVLSVVKRRAVDDNIELRALKHSSVDFRIGLVARAGRKEFLPLDQNLARRTRNVQKRIWEENFKGSCTCKQFENRASKIGVKYEDEWLSFCPAGSYWNFVPDGLEVEPLRSVKLTGTSLNIGEQGEKGEPIALTLNFRSRFKLGSLCVLPTIGVSVQGNCTQKLRAGGSLPLETWNRFMEKVWYLSLKYTIDDHDVVDIEESESLKSAISLRVRIRNPRLEFTDESVGGIPSKDLSQLITVTTKTFERFDAITRLVSSVNRFYPNITVIVADDSETPQKIPGKNVKHFTMPFAEGWFAGRNLALSQVRTKYFMWLDDDMAFTKDTRLERLLDVMEKARPPPDIVAGVKDGDRNDMVFRVQYTKDGSLCLDRKPGHYQAVDGFPDCVWADHTANFFLGRTLSVRQVGFDPFYERVAHSEFFADAFGRLRVATCDGVEIAHGRTSNNKYKYYRSRKADPNDRKKCQTHFFESKSNLACFWI